MGGSRAAALAAELSRSRIITPTLTDDAATLTVTLDVAAILAALEETRREAIEEAARKALGQANYDHTGYTDYLPYDLAVNHCSRAIRALLDPPDSKRPGTPADDGPDVS